MLRVARPNPELKGETKLRTIECLQAKLRQTLGELAEAVADLAAAPDPAKAASLAEPVHAALLHAWALGALGVPLVKSPDGTGWTIGLGPGQAEDEDETKEAGGC